MANVVDEERLASVADIAAELNRSVGSVSSVRAGLVNNGIIISPKRGKLAFMIPYLADFIQHQPEATPSIAQTVTAWKM
jgi:hypothetical protein